MVKEGVFVSKTDTEESLRAEMETEHEIGNKRNEKDRFALEEGEGSNMVFSREAPLVSKESRISSGCSCSANNLNSKRVIAMYSELAKEKIGHEKKLSQQDRIELGQLLQRAMSSHDWELAESVISLADPQTLNDALCITLDSIWFLSTEQELHGVTGLIKNIIASGAYDFTRTAFRTAFLASCVSACQSRTMSLADTVTVMAQRLREHLQECNGDEVLKAEASAKVQKFTEWALRCIGFHSRCHGNRGIE